MTIGRIYTVSFAAVAIGTAAQDLFELVPADDKVLRLMALYLDNVGGTADASDVQEEFIRIEIIRAYATSGSGGTAPTPQPVVGTTASSFTAEVNNTTVASTGTPLTIAAFGMNVRAGLREVFPDEMQVGCAQGDIRLVIRSASTLADAITMSGTVWVAEID